MSTAAACGVLAAPAHAQMVRASTGAGGTQATGSSREPVLDAEGQRIYFASNAPDLVPGDTNNSWDVFEKNLTTGAIRRISLAQDGTERVGDSGFGGIDVDFPIVVFTSRAALVASDTNTCTAPDDGTGASCPDIYSVNANTGVVDMLTLGANGPSRQPRILDDVVVFETDATNVAPGLDTNNATDVIRKQGTTYTRLSLSTTGQQGNGPSFRPVISGERIAFLSNATNLTDVADPRPCPSAASTLPCTRAYVLNVNSPLRRVDAATTDPPLAAAYVTDVEVNDKTVVIAQFNVPPGVSPSPGSTDVFYQDPLTQNSMQLAFTAPGLGVSLGLSIPTAAGTTIALGVLNSGSQLASVQVFNYGLRQVEQIAAGSVPTSGTLQVAHRLDAASKYVVFATAANTLVAGDTNDASDVFRFDRDVDQDTIPSYWETLFGLNPNDGADGTADPDNDGVTNAQEYQQVSHPLGHFKYYLAEGAANGFFSTRIAYLNPNSANQPRTLTRFLSSQDESQTIGLVPPPVMLMDVLGRSSITLNAGSLRFTDFSTVIESNQPIVVDRTMTWDATGFGAHAETATSTLSGTWYLAEGATHGAFDLFYLLQNSSTVDSMATVTYLRPAPAAPIVKQYSLPARSRKTIWVDAEGPELANTDVSAIITGASVAERSMYLSRPGQSFAAGHNGMGLTAPATRWFLAEGATGPFFDLYLLIANPGSSQAALTVTYLLPGNQSFTKNYTVAASSRITIGVDGEDARLANTPVSLIVESTSAVPVLVERSMWWPSPLWYEGHLAAGTTTTGTKWGLAEGELGGSRNAETYILIANTSASAGNATVTLILDSGTTLTQTVALSANSRVNVQVSDLFPGAAGHLFGAVIESNGVEIVVERAMYWTANGETWTAGTAAVATKLQ